jgi:hypothetical protein
VNNQEILDNAPGGSSDIDDVNNYWSYQGNGDYYFWEGGKWIENWSPFHVRSLADIKRIAELEKRLSNAETMGSEEQARRDLEQQAKGIEDFFNSIDPQISMGERKLWSLQSHNVDCYLDNLREQAKGGAE